MTRNYHDMSKTLPSLLLDLAWTKGKENYTVYWYTSLSNLPGV